MNSVLSYFEEIMQIPRESGKEEKIADYLVNYAKENNIEYSFKHNAKTRGKEIGFIKTEGEESEKKH